MTADLQARRRLGLTATLVREDGREGDVFSLIGPKRFDAPWKDIENQGYIAPADCVEVRVTLPEDERLVYAVAEPDERYRLCATSEQKTKVVEQLVARHRGEPMLVIGQFIDQLDDIAARIDAPLIKGETTVKERQRLFEAFRSGEITTLVVSKVANFSIDLPEAAVAIQVSGAFGSRQEEAQRLGRVLRPKADGRTARFYAVVARDTQDQEFAQHRQRFLAEQGYAYRIVDADDLAGGAADVGGRAGLSRGPALGLGAAAPTQVRKRSLIRARSGCGRAGVAGALGGGAGGLGHPGDARGDLLAGRGGPATRCGRSRWWSRSAAPPRRRSGSGSR